MPKPTLLLFLPVLFMLLLPACGSPAVAAPEPSLTATAPPPTGTATATASATVTPTPSASASPTTTRVAQGPDAVLVPILLYHRIDVSPINSQYYVPPAQFEAQMKLLHDWEYTVIPLDLLLRAIREGADLPPRPVIITFDDGDASVYASALPVMQRYGFTGVAYIVGNYMGTPGYMDAAQVRALAAAGWEIGSHSRSHRDLTRLEPAVQREEIVTAREDLQERLGLPVNSFAYPFGLAGAGVIDYVKFAGYTSGMGLGFTSDQGKSNLYWLQRRDIKGSYDLQAFAALLPWRGDPAFLPEGTPAATAATNSAP